MPQPPNEHQPPKPNMLKMRWMRLKIYAGWLRRRLKAPWSDPNEQELVRAVNAFRQFSFTDPQTGIRLSYNLYIPQGYDPQQSYPLVLFIHDAGAVSGDAKMTLIQGLGAVVWATASDQARHPCFVLAPQYSKGFVNDRSEAALELEATVNLVKAVAGQYSIDPDRLYTTGQSMGCMASIEMMIRYPDLFAAALLVAGQWDAARMSVLNHAKLWIVVSEGDRRAFPGMNASLAALEAAGASISRAVWNGRASAQEFAQDVQRMLDENRFIKYTVLAKGTVVPEGQPDDGGSNHIHTWRIAYAIPGLRDWLLEQKKG